MKKYCAFLTVRLNSTRLKKKCLLKLNDKTIIEHCILRSILGGITPIICTTNNNEDKFLIKTAKKYSIKIYLGSEKNKILRWFLCAKKFNIKKFHTIDVDDPYFDIYAIKESMKLLSYNHIILPSDASRIGGASEGYSFNFKGIKNLVKSLKKYKYKSFNNMNTEMIDGFLKKLNSRKTILKKFKGTKHEIKKNIRLTLDYQKDYVLLKKISNYFHFSSDRKKINFFLKKNKDILKINIKYEKKWKDKQNSFLIPSFK